MNNIIVGMGEALWDVLPDGKKIGGAPANFAYHSSQFGFNSYVVSAVGNDDLGEEILYNFKSKKLNYLETKVQQPTGTVQVTLDDKGIPCYDIKQDVAWDNIPFTSDSEKLAENTRVVCFGSLAQRNSVSRNTINRFIDKMPSDDFCYKIFDINLRQQKLKEAIYLFLLQKLQEKELINSPDEVAGRVIDTAYSSYKHIFPRTSIILAIAFVIACMLSLIAISLKIFVFNKK